MRTILLTGIGPPGQVGVAVAEAFASAGDRVLLVSREAGTANERAGALRSSGYTASGYGCDLADPSAVERLAQTVLDDHGPALDAAVLMAGGFGGAARVADSDAGALSRMFEINVKTAYFTARSFLPMLRAGRGSIVFFASEAILPGGRAGGISAYAIAKSGVAALMTSIAQEERESGVRSNALAPASIRTATNLASMGEGTRYVEREAVAGVVMFLCSDAGAGITGQILRLAAEPDRR